MITVAGLLASAIGLGIFSWTREYYHTAIGLFGIASLMLLWWSFALWQALTDCSFVKKLAIRLFKRRVRRDGRIPGFGRSIVHLSGPAEWIQTNYPLWSFILPLQTDDLWDRCLYDQLTKEVFQLRSLDQRPGYARLSINSDAVSALSPQQRLEAALSFLGRHNSVWREDHLQYFTKLPEYVKNISNPFAEELIGKALQHPWLYRLNFIKQLGTTCHFQNLDASHHRLPHAIGTAEAAALMLESLDRELEDNPFGKAEVQPVEKKAVVLYALTHDAGHGPFGHSLEPMRGILAHGLERLDKQVMRKALESGGDMELLAVKIAGSDNASEIVDLMKFLHTRDDRFPDYHGKYFLTEIVDSTLDADRFDYLMRDALHLGQPRYDKNRWIDVLMAARVVDEPVGNPGGDAKRRKMIAFPREQLDRINQLLSLRRDLYTDYYESPSKLAVDEMVCHAVYYHFLNAGLLDVPPSQASQKDRFFHEFLKLTDETLFPFLTELQELMEPEAGIYGKRLIGDILTNRHFQSLKNFGIRVDQASQVIEEREGFAQMVDQARGEEARSPWKMTGDRQSVELKRLQIVKSVYDTQPLSDEALLLYFANLMYGSYDHKWIFEKELWHSVLDDPNVSDAWRDILYSTYGSVGKDLEQHLKDVPHIHITLPPFVAMVSKERMVQCFSDVPLPQDLSEPFVPKVLCYDQQGQVEWLTPSLSYPGDAYLHYEVILSAHFDLTQIPGFKKIVEEKFLEKVNSFDWLMGGSQTS